MLYLAEVGSGTAATPTSESFVLDRGMTGAPQRPLRGLGSMWQVN